MSEHSMEKPIAEQMLDWAERLDKRFYLFNKESLYSWLIIKAPRVVKLEAENAKLKRVRDAASEFVSYDGQDIYYGTPKQGMELISALADTQKQEAWHPNYECEWDGCWCHAEGALDKYIEEQGDDD